MYEDLYLYCTFVVWITFRRKELERVKIEMGNMLRSEVFNPALKQKIKSSIAAEAKKAEKDWSKSVGVALPGTFSTVILSIATGIILLLFWWNGTPPIRGTIG